MNKLELLRFAENNNIYIVRHKCIDEVSEINNYFLDVAKNNDDLDHIWDQVNTLETNNTLVYDIRINLYHPSLDLNQIKKAADKYEKYPTCHLKTGNITMRDLKRAKSLCFNNINESMLYNILNILDTGKA